MAARKLQFGCPVCNSPDVFYSCTPNCCFNHVCAACGATFEPVTSVTGGARPGLAPPDPLPDASDPTVACARCDSVNVYLDEDNAVVCSACGAVLVLEITEIAVGG